MGNLQIANAYNIWSNAWKLRYTKTEPRTITRWTSSNLLWNCSSERMIYPEPLIV